MRTEEPSESRAKQGINIQYIEERSEERGATVLHLGKTSMTLTMENVPKIA